MPHTAATNPIRTFPLSYRPPYDWQAMLNFLSMRAIPGVEQVCDGSYLRTISYEGRAGWIKARNDAEMNVLHITVSFPDASALPGIISRVQNIFDLAADPAVIGAALSRDPQLAPLVSARPGLRVPGAWDGFELAVRAILGQQITVAAATRLASRLVPLYGEALSENHRIGELTHLFPAAAQLADQDIAQIGMPRARGAAIAGLAERSLANLQLFTAYPTLQDAVISLCALPGIGEWTAQYIAMRWLRESDAFPAGDVALMRALREPGGPRINAAALLAKAEAWRPWRAYAALHVWAADAASSSARTRKD